MQKEKKDFKYDKVATLTRKGFMAGDISTVMVLELFYIGQKIQKYLKMLVMHLE